MGFKVKNKLSPSYTKNVFPSFIPITKINLRKGKGRDKLMFQMDNPANKKYTLFEKIKKSGMFFPYTFANVKTFTNLRRN